MEDPFVVEELRLLVEGFFCLSAERDGERRREHVREEDGADDAAAEGRAVRRDVYLKFGERQTGAAALSVMEITRAPLRCAISTDSVTSTA